MTTLRAHLLTPASFAKSSSFPSSTSKRSRQRLWLKLVLHALAVSPLILGAALPGLAATATVTSLADDGSAATLRSLMAAAAPGDAIVFNVTGTITLTLGFREISQNLTISGPGAASLFISGANTFTVFQIDPGVTTATISGLTIENGYSSSVAGGGINNQGTLTLSNSIVSNNLSSNDGAGIYNTGTLMASHSTVSGNVGGLPGASGAGIYNSSSGTLTVNNSALSGNGVHDGGEGGAIFNGGRLTLNNSFVLNNISFFGTGAGVYNSGSGTATVSASALAGNSSVEDGGGGIVNDGTLAVINSTLAGNSSTDGNEGGAILNFGMLTISDSTLAGNSATVGGKGGAIFNGGTLILKSTLLAGQSSGGNCDGFGNSLSDGLTCLTTALAPF